MKKILPAFLASLFLLIGSGAALYYDSCILSPTNFKIGYVDEESPLIPDNFDNISILFFSDLCYGNHFNKDALQKLSDEISTLNYDVVLFGGDVFDNDYSPVSDDVELLSEFFASFSAKLGKFAIQGDYDCSSETRQALINRILKEGNFELLQNSLPIYNQSLSTRIMLYGFSYNESVNLPLEKDSYTLVMVHGSGCFAAIGNDADFALSGHSHQWQINLPLSGHDYPLGKTDHFYLCPSIGMSKHDYRLFNDPVLLCLTLKSTN